MRGCPTTGLSHMHTSICMTILLFFVSGNKKEKKNPPKKGVAPHSLTFNNALCVDLFTKEQYTVIVQKLSTVLMFDLQDFFLEVQPFFLRSFFTIMVTHFAPLLENRKSEKKKRQEEGGMI